MAAARGFIGNLAAACYPARFYGSPGGSIERYQPFTMMGRERERDQVERDQGERMIQGVPSGEEEQKDRRNDGRPPIPEHRADAVLVLFICAVLVRGCRVVLLVLLGDESRVSG